MSTPGLAPNDYALIENVVNKLAPASQEDARSLLQSFSQRIAQLNENTGTSAGQSQQNIAAPPQASLSASGANGVITAMIANPANSQNQPLWHEISVSTSANFTSGVTTLPASQATSVTIPASGQTLYLRLRSSVNRQVWNGYQVYGQPVEAGLVSSAATSSGGAFNQTNLGIVTSATSVGGAVAVQIAGAGGGLTGLVALKGSTKSVLPAGAIVNVAPNTEQFVGYDGSHYQLKPTLAATLADNLTPIGKVSVVGTGSPALPTIAPIVSGGGVVGYNVTNQGNGLTGPLTLTVVDPGESGAGATTGAQTITNGKLIAVAAGNAGALYGANTAVDVFGGVNPGTVGGGTAAGGNGGRMTNV